MQLDEQSNDLPGLGHDRPSGLLAQPLERGLAADERRHAHLAIFQQTGNWFQVDPERIEASIQDTSIVHAVFTDVGTLATVLKEIQEADLGLSVVVSGLLGSVREMCCKLGMTPAPHTVEHSLGVWGKVEALQREEILEISTMCSHGR